MPEFLRVCMPPVDLNYTVCLNPIINSINHSSICRSGQSPSSSVWPHLSYGLVRSKREYCHNCCLLVVLCSFLYSCTVIWAAYKVLSIRFGFISLNSSLCLDYFVCVRLFSCIICACMLYYCNTARWAWLDWGLSGWLTTLLQYFDTVGWVIRPVKTVGRITYIVLVQT